MSRSIGFNICMVTCSILLLSSSPPCVASLPLKKRDMTKVQLGHWAGNGVEDERTSMLNLKNNLGPSEQTISEKPCGVLIKPSGIPLNEAFTAEGEQLSVSLSHVIPGSQGLGDYTSAVAVAVVDEGELRPTKSELEEDDAFKAMLTTAVTTLSPTVQEESVVGPISGTTTEGGVEVEHSSPGLLANPLSGTAVEEEAGSNSHPSVAPQPTVYPSSPRWETASDHPVILTPQAHSITPELGVTRPHTGSPLKSLVVRASVAAKHLPVVTSASLHLEAGTGGRQGELPTVAGSVTIHTMDMVPPDWDDTKVRDISQGGSVSLEVTEDLGITEPSQAPQGGAGEEEDVVRVVPSPVSTPPAPELAKETNCTALVRGEELPAASTGHGDIVPTANLVGVDMADLNSLENISSVTAEERKSIPPPQPQAAVVTDMQSDRLPTLESSWKGVTQEVTTVVQESDAALLVATPVPGATQGAGPSSFPQENSGEDTQMVTTPSATQMVVAAGTSSAANLPDVEDITHVLVTSEKAVPAPGEMSATQSGQTEEPSSRTMVLVTPASMASSVRRTALPPVRRISTAETYGLDRLESEEGEEEDEEEEDEEEEEEEDEEDKDIDLMDESMEGDTELPGFMLPGETSQEPIAGLENPVAQLAGVSYQVPDTIEWEQQNQGLVRSWMEKLKDKAGYMSGMLVPVGVGIAGALFILGALYSIKIMNRRRRNGSKRHKRKQREFNSMQDRVMLLADSSEDEF
ncbi:armadillo-like helical domain-containing protein 4 isoform X1 [Pezoporus wallicus]|uniref:armadillo-like helical domain-containing protein 4 isoform X1 n=1 Tax=Pezoporus wallicus TaxID=35540 RepID=UPI00254CA3E1|nr:armadillo-like helical domain-containing protein 4 isoform X1 [Pezoporus wallicus]XP_057289029.1 armadillo-like helical domain-containing protein 4 isoform X1 [Pezoporus wallicus]